MELSSGNSIKAYQGSYQWKASALFLVVFADLMITCFADHYHNPQHAIWYPLTLLGYAATFRPLPRELALH